RIDRDAAPEELATWAERLVREVIASKDPSERETPVRVLVALVGRLPPELAGPPVRQAIRTLTESPPDHALSSRWLIALLEDALEPNAEVLLTWRCATLLPDNFYHSEDGGSILRGHLEDGRAASIGAAFLPGFGRAAVYAATLDRSPGRLSAQQLVDLLKHP